MLNALNPSPLLPSSRSAWGMRFHRETQAHYASTGFFTRSLSDAAHARRGYACGRAVAGLLSQFYRRHPLATVILGFAWWASCSGTVCAVSGLSVRTEDAASKQIMRCIEALLLHIVVQWLSRCGHVIGVCQHGGQDALGSTHGST